MTNIESNEAEELAAVATTAETTTETTATTSTAKLTAKEKAELRRRRILEQSKNRMSFVNGDTSTASATVTTTDEGTDDDAKEGTSVSEVVAGNDEAVATTEDTTVTTTTTTASSTTTSIGQRRLAQARKRRYKKSISTVASTNDGGESGKTTSNKETINSNKKEEKEEKEATPPLMAEKNEDTSTRETKKYLGVAKMRRRRLAEKKAVEAASTETTEPAATKDKKPRKEIMRKKIPLLPIFVQLLTVWILFCAGLDIGIQNNYQLVNVFEKDEQKQQEMIMLTTPRTVHENLSIVENGFSVFNSLFGTKGSTMKNDDLFASSSNQEDQELDFMEEEENEFEPMKPQGVSSSSSEPNIDPIFGIDLDELTRNKSGIFMMMARLAISIHRKITFLFFTAPMTFVTSLKTTLLSLFSSEPGTTGRPIMFLYAVIIRTIAKHVFGAQDVPDLDTVLEAKLEAHSGPGLDAASDESKKGRGLGEMLLKGNVDVIAMGSNFVSNFFKSNFPTLSFIYGVFRAARSDMYIIFCGLFIGLILSPTSIIIRLIVSVQSLIVGVEDKFLEDVGHLPVMEEL